MKPDCGEDFETTPTKSRKKRKRLYPVDSIFFNSFRPFSKVLFIQRHISDTSPATFPHCDMMYEKRKPANLIFLWSWMEGESIADPRRGR